MGEATRVTKSRFEIVQDGQTAHLEFETDGHGWMTIWHTEVPREMRGKGIALELVANAFQYARENSLRVDVICPVAKKFMEKQPEFKALVGRR